MESALRATAHGNHVAGNAKLRSRSRGRSHSQAHASAASAAPNKCAAIARAFQSRSRGRHAIRTPCMRSRRSTQPMTQPIRIMATLLNSTRVPAECSHSLSLVPMSQKAISFSIHIPDAIFMRGLRRAKLRSLCYALRPSCDRARNPTACVQSAILVPPSQEAFLSRSGIPDARFMQALRRTKLRNQCTAARTRCDRTRLPKTCSRSPCLALRRRAIANFPARLEPRKVTQPRLRVAAALRPRAHCDRTFAIKKPRALKFRVLVLKRERSCKTHAH